MLSTQDQGKLKAIAKILKQCESILVITGAGISAESGLPTFRGISGLYNNKDTEDGIPVEVAHSGEMMRERPEIAWKYLVRLAKSCRKARYNQAHRILSDFDDRFKRVVIYTQNVDGFHKQAGSKNVIEIHGNFDLLSCMNSKCDYRTIVKSYASLIIPPPCPACGGYLRPDIVLFGEALHADKIEWFNREMIIGFDIVFSIGTTSVFPYITLPVEMSKEMGVPTVEINPGETTLSDVVDYKITSGAVEALTALDMFIRA